MTTKILFIFTYLLACTYTSIAQEKTVARFLYFQPSARANAMGGSAVAMERSSFEGYNNPALLAFAPNFCLSGTWQNPLPIFDRNHIYGTASFRIDTVQVVNAAMNIYTEGTHQRTFDNGSPGQIFTANSATFTVAYSRRLSSQLSVGAGVGLLRINLAPINTSLGLNATATGLLFNAGFLYRNLLEETTYTDMEFETAKYADKNSSKGVAIGMALSNIGPKVKFENSDAGNDAPSTVTVGAAYSQFRTGLGGLQLALDFEKRIYESGLVNRIHAGCEVKVLRYVCLRAGYNAGTESSASSFLTLGAGVNLPFLHVSVARYTRALLPTWQFSASYIFE
ncbi:MAG: PorV/PorQ family protein [Bacteroidetes bacterium]|nr:PorV/PorQ family protein [Bacteroidota bacterium]